MPFARIMEARLMGTLHGSDTVNVFHFGTNENPANNEALVQLLIDLSFALITCALQQLIPATTSDWTLETCDVKQIFPVVTDEVQGAAPVGSVGTTGAVNTSFESVLMRIRTGGGGKRGRGRKFLPPPGDAHITNSVLVDGSASDFYSGFLACLADAFIGAGATTPFRIGVLSRRHLQLNPGDFANAFREATQLSIEQRMSCLRSRKLGNGS